MSRYQIRNTKGLIVGLMEAECVDDAMVSLAFCLADFHSMSVQIIERPSEWAGTLWEISDSAGVVGYQAAYTPGPADYLRSLEERAMAVFRRTNVDYTAQWQPNALVYTATALGTQCPQCSGLIAGSFEECTLPPTEWQKSTGQSGDRCCRACYTASCAYPPVAEEGLGVLDHGRFAALAEAHGGSPEAIRAAAKIDEQPPGWMRVYDAEGRPLSEADIQATAQREAIAAAARIRDIVRLPGEADDELAVRAIKVLSGRSTVDGRTFDISDTDQRAAYLAVKSGVVAPPEPAPAKPPCSYCGGDGCGLSGFIPCPECG